MASATTNAYKALSLYNDDLLKDQNPNAYAELLKYKQQWAQADASGDNAGMAAARNSAENIRKAAGYTTNDDGSGYIPYSQPAAAYTPTAAYTLENPYKSLQEETNQKLAAMKKTELESADNGYNTLERQAYINKRQTEANMPATLARTGQTGGMAESTAIKPSVAYGNQLSQIGAERQNAKNTINQNYGNKELQYAIDFADKIIAQNNYQAQFDYQKQRDSVSDQQYKQSFDYNAARDIIGDKQYDKNFDYNAARDTITDNRYADQLAYQKQQNELDRQYQQSVFDYNKTRDNVSDTRYADETSYERNIYQEQLEQKAAEAAAQAKTDAEAAAYDKAINIAKYTGDYSELEKLLGSPSGSISNYQKTLAQQEANSSFSELGDYTKSLIEASKDYLGKTDAKVFEQKFKVFEQKFKEALSKGLVTQNEYEAAKIQAGITEAKDGTLVAKKYEEYPSTKDMPYNYLLKLYNDFKNSDQDKLTDDELIFYNDVIDELDKRKKNNKITIPNVLNKNTEKQENPLSKSIMYQGNNRNYTPSSTANVSPQSSGNVSETSGTNQPPQYIKDEFGTWTNADFVDMSDEDIIKAVNSGKMIPKEINGVLYLMKQEG
ncbi:MAG: hypothetical protein VB118_04815 [Oscillospiraceae bacterium]|nr:hypothetical protein [Oscillospiraceae bacterium]